MAPPKKTYLRKKKKNHKFVVKVRVPKPSDFIRRIGPPCQGGRPKKKKTETGTKLEFSEFPTDIVENILERLSSADRIRFGATSKKNISFVTTTNPTTKHHPRRRYDLRRIDRTINHHPYRYQFRRIDRIPWLAEFCRSYPNSGLDFKLFEPLHLRGQPHYVTCEIRNPKGEEGLGSGRYAELKASRKGWFLCLWPKQTNQHRTHDGQDVCLTSFLLFSPFNKRIIKLPDHNFNSTCIGSCLATFSSDPASPDCAYFFLSQDAIPGQIVISTLQQRSRKWKTKVFDGHAISGWHLQSVVYHEGCFYCLSFDGRLAAYDVLRERFKVIIPSAPVVSSWDSGRMRVNYQYHILVCEGKLLLAFAEIPLDSGNDMERLRCGLFEFSSSTRTWVQKTSVGNHAIFLGDHTSFPVPVSSSSWSSSCDENIADRMYFFPTFFRQVGLMYYSFKDGRCHNPKEGGYWSSSTGVGARVWFEPLSPPELA